MEKFIPTSSLEVSVNLCGADSVIHRLGGKFLSSSPSDTSSISFPIVPGMNSTRYLQNWL